MKFLTGRILIVVLSIVSAGIGLCLAQETTEHPAAEALDLTTLLPPSFGPNSARNEFAARLNRIQFRGYVDWRYPSEFEKAFLVEAGIVQPEPGDNWPLDQVLTGDLPPFQYATGWIVASHWIKIHNGHFRSTVIHQVIAIREHPD